MSGEGVVNCAYIIKGLHLLMAIGIGIYVIVQMATVTSYIPENQKEFTINHGQQYLINNQTDNVMDVKQNGWHHVATYCDAPVPGILMYAVVSLCLVLYSVFCGSDSKKSSNDSEKNMSAIVCAVVITSTVSLGLGLGLGVPLLVYPESTESCKELITTVPQIGMMIRTAGAYLVTSGVVSAITSCFAFA